MKMYSVNHKNVKIQQYLQYLKHLKISMISNSILK